MSPTSPADSIPAARVLRRQRLLRSLAMLAAALMLGVIGLSAFIRLAHGPLGAADATAPEAAIVLARALHRVIASVLLVLALTLLAAALPRPLLRREAGLALGIVLCTLWLAGLGIAARGSTLPAVVLGNLVGGFLMLALCLRLAAVAAGRVASPRLRRAAGWALPAVLASVVVGGLYSAGALPPTCAGWRDCIEAARGADWDWRVLDPWLARGEATAQLALQRGAWLPLLHQAAAALALALLLWLDWTAWRERARAGHAPLAVLLALQVLLVLSAVATPSLAQALAHNLAGALLLGWLARLA
ncbi:hypothetical protein FBQ98_00145 [Gammaproteobacteria bacterium PRO6]|nr:hypothetical protein [Gammaproteobacteria bacterium PRO6]